MKQLTLMQQQQISGGQSSISPTLIVATGLLVTAFAVTIALNEPSKNNKNAPKGAPSDWEKVLKDTRNMYYEDGFAQGYMAGKADGLAIAATGKLF